MIEKFHPVTHVIFDMDGLLLNSEPLYEDAISEICKRYGSTYTLEAKLHAMGKTARDSANAVITHCNLPISIDEFLKLMEKEYLRVFGNGVDFMPGASRLVKHLSCGGIPQAIATSSKKSTFKLKSVGKDEFFKMFNHIVIGTDDPEVKKGKPNPDIFLVAASRFPSPPSDMKNVLVFEDSVAGVQAGLAAGMQVVWVPDPCLDVNSQSATLILKSLQEFDPKLFQLPDFTM